MQIATTFETTPKIVMRSYEACHPSARPTRWGIAAIGIALSVAIHSPVPFVTSLAAISLLVSVARYQLRHYLAGPRRVSLTLDDEAYRVMGQDGTARAFAWSTFVGVERRRGFFVFRASRTKAIAFPETALDEQQKHELLDFLRRSGLGAK